MTKGKVAIVDSEDYEYLSLFKWYAHSQGYAARDTKVNGKRVTLLMHRVIMEAKDGEQVDHRNEDKLYNCRCNLRIADFSQNDCNKSIRKDNKSGYKGVYRKRGKYAAEIRKNKIKYFLGYFDNPEDAARMYNFWALDLHGEFANLNKMYC